MIITVHQIEICRNRHLGVLTADLHFYRVDSMSKHILTFFISEGHLIAGNPGPKDLRMLSQHYFSTARGAKAFMNNVRNCSEFYSIDPLYPCGFLKSYSFLLSIFLIPSYRAILQIRWYFQFQRQVFAISLIRMKDDTILQTKVPIQAIQKSLARALLASNTRGRCCSET